jgi:hypothetical protein
MPSLAEHYRWVSERSRYRGELADAFRARAEKAGDGYLEYQAHFHPMVSGSRRNDLEDFYGMSRAQQRVLYQRNCFPRDYPLLFLVGLKPVAIGDGTVYVREARGLYSIVSLRALGAKNESIRLALAGSGKILCTNIIPESLNINTQACSDLAKHFDEH